MPKLDGTVFRWALCCALAAPMLAQDTIRTTVNEVALDLVVRDKKGRLVKNLKPGDVQIYEDGVLQEVRSLRLVSGAAPPAPTVPPAEQPSREAAPESAPPQAMPLHSPSLLCIVFHNLDSVTRKWAVAAAQDYVKTELRPGTWVGVFNLDSRLTPLQSFTMNQG